MSTKRASAETTEQQRRARLLPHVDRAKRIAAMLDRWDAEDVNVGDDEPEWDVGDVERVSIRPPSS
jgi:hypothetical protein